MGKQVFIENWDSNGEWFNPCSLYNWRLDWLERRVKQHRDNGFIHSDRQYQQWWDEEHQVWENNERDIARAKRLSKSIGIIVPSHAHQRVWLQSCLKSLQKTGYFILLAYDNPFHGDHPLDQRLPSPQTFHLADEVILKHKTWASGVGIPHAWNMFYGVKMLKALGFEYIFNLNGDCILEKPENFPQLVELLGDNDFIACELRPEQKYCGTMSWLGRTDIVDEIWSEYIHDLYKFNIGNAEARMGRHILNKGYSIVPVDNPAEAHFKPTKERSATDDATFRVMLGLRHLHAELKIRRVLHLESIEEKYFEKKFMSRVETETLGEYWKTGDKKFLKDWWV